MRCSPRPLAWEQWDDEKLLRTTIQKLQISLRHIPWLEQEQQNLHRELQQAGLQYLRPQIYLADEWFTPDGSALIAIPFYLAHPRLMQLERRMMGYVEGATRTEFRKLLRHEAGHCFDHAYRLERDPLWAHCFGDRSQPYEPDHYRPRLYSRRYVHHLADGYAQAHPEEDFAETFALFMTPTFLPHRRYGDAPTVLQKFSYIEQTVKQWGHRVPKGLHEERWSNVSHCKITLGEFYRRKRAQAVPGTPCFHDAHLQKIFSRRQGPVTACRYLQDNATILSNQIASLSGRYRYEARRLIAVAAKRAQDLNLFLKSSERQTREHVVMVLSAMVTQQQTTPN